MDVCDIKGDYFNDSNSFPIIFGEKITSYIGFIFQLLGVIILFPVIYNQPHILNISLYSSIFFCFTLFIILWFSK